MGHDHSKLEQHTHNDYIYITTTTSTIRNLIHTVTTTATVTVPTTIFATFTQYVQTPSPHPDWYINAVLKFWLLGYCVVMVCLGVWGYAFVRGTLDPSWMKPEKRGLVLTNTSRNVRSKSRSRRTDDQIPSANVDSAPPPY